MTVFRKRMMSLLWIAIFGILITPTSPSASSHFSDVKMDHWAYASIKWGSAEGIIKGYPDGSFKPDNPVTEAQFVMMLSRLDGSVKSTFTAIPSEHYTSAIYRYFEGRNISLKGYSDHSLRDKPITRGKVAQVIAAFNGFDLSPHHAVQYMYMEDLSSGLTGKKDYQDYGSHLTMTRAQAVTFFQRLSAKGSSQLIGSKQKATGKDDKQYPLPFNFLGDGTITFPSPEKEPQSPAGSQSSNEFVREIDIEKETLIANGVDSTFVTLTLNDCYGNAMPYEESLNFRVASREGAIFNQEQYREDYLDFEYHEDYKDYFDLEESIFAAASTQTVYTDGPDITVKVTAPPSSKAVTDKISFQINETSTKMACYREPITVNLDYEPKAELRLEVANSTNLLSANRNREAVITATIVLPGGEVISDYNGRVRFSSAEGAYLSDQEADFYNGVARTDIQSIKSNRLIMDRITAEIIEEDPRYASKLESVVKKKHQMEIVYEPPLEFDNSCARPEIAFVIDSSGSMRRNDPERFRVTKSQEMITSLNAPRNIAARFNSNGYLLDIGIPSVVRPTLNSIGASGGTNIKKGLDVAFRNFTSGGRKVVILLTDGQSNERQVLDMMELAKEKGISIFTIGLGSEKQLNGALLQRIASETGGKYYHVEENFQIGAAYQSILNELNCSVPVPSCSDSSLSFISPAIEVTNEDVYMKTFIEDYCGEISKVVVRFHSYHGTIDYELVYRGQNYYARKRGKNEIENFILFQDGELLAYDWYGNIIDRRRVPIQTP